MQCVILAGGLGTRMLPLTSELPKTLIPVLGRPFADYQLQWLKSEGVTDVVYCVGHLGSQVRDFVGDGSRWGIRVTWVDEGTVLRGTAGALRLAFESGALLDSFFVLYGDSYLNVHLTAVRDAFEQRRQPALMTVLRNRGLWDTSNVNFSDGQIYLYDKRPGIHRDAMEYIDYGLSILTRDLVRDRIPRGQRADLADLLHELSREGRLAGFEVTERFYEIGSPEGLRDLEEHLSVVA